MTMNHTLHARMLTTLLVGIAAVAPCLGGQSAPSKSKSSNFAIITNWGDDTCSLVSVESVEKTREAEQISVIKVGAKPYDVKVESGGRFAYVTCSGADFISVIDLQANLEDQKGRIRIGQGPRDLVLSPDEKRIVVANSGEDTISVVDRASGQQLYTVPVGNIPYGVGLARDGKLAVITLWGSNQVALVELGETAGRVLKHIPVGNLPYTVGIAASGDLALVTCFGSHRVDVIDLQSMSLLSPSVEVGKSPWGLAISDDGASALVANFYAGSASFLQIAPTEKNALSPHRSPVSEVARVDLASELKEQSSPAAGPVQAARHRAKNSSISSDGLVALMTDLSRNKVMVLDMKSRKLRGEISVGHAPYGIAFIPKR